MSSQADTQLTSSGTAPELPQHTSDQAPKKRTRSHDETLPVKKQKTTYDDDLYRSLSGAGSSSSVGSSTEVIPCRSSGNPFERGFSAPLEYDFMRDQPDTEDLDFVQDFQHLLFTPVFSCSAITPEPQTEVYTNSSLLTSHAVGYHSFSPQSRRALERQKVIEEIIETEQSYISSLRMLSGIYLETLINKGNNGVPVKAIHAYVGMLISAHDEFLEALRHLFTVSSKIHVFEKSPSAELVSCASPMMAALVSELISTKAISIYLYQEYSSIHDLVLKLISFESSGPETGSLLTKSYQFFLESTQRGADRLDLSFISLVSKPVSRISRYKLFLQALAKLTPAEENEACSKRIADSIVQVEYSIMEVNRYGLLEKIKSDIIFSGLTFGDATLKFPVEYLGLPMLTGALHASWVDSKDNDVASHIFGAFLFKSHLILATVTKSTRFEVRFLIPLSVCRVLDSDDIQGGMCCHYLHSFKLRFENNFRLYEILLTASDFTEHDIWREKLVILTEVVNGPYKFDYSSSSFNEELGTQSSTLVPPSIQSFDAKLDKLTSGSARRHIHHHNPYAEQCYFREIIPIKIEVSDDHGSFSSVRFKLLMTEHEKGIHVLMLRSVDKARVENLMEELWSDELFTFEFLDRRKKSVRPRTRSWYVPMNPHDSGVGNKAKELGGSTRKRDSLMRKTSILGDAFKAMFAGNGAVHGPGSPG